MKIKEGQPCHRYFTAGFWKIWTRKFGAGNPFSKFSKNVNIYVIRSSSVRSELLIALAK